MNLLLHVHKGNILVHKIYFITRIIKLKHSLTNTIQTINIFIDTVKMPACYIPYIYGIYMEYML